MAGSKRAHESDSETERQPARSEVAPSTPANEATESDLLSLATNTQCEDKSCDMTLADSCDRALDAIKEALKELGESTFYCGDHEPQAKSHKHFPDKERSPLVMDTTIGGYALSEDDGDGALLSPYSKRGGSTSSQRSSGGRSPSSAVHSTAGSGANSPTPSMIKRKKARRASWQPEEGEDGAEGDDEK